MAKIDNVRVEVSVRVSTQETYSSKALSEFSLTRGGKVALTDASGILDEVLADAKTVTVSTLNALIAAESAQAVELVAAKTS